MKTVHLSMSAQIVWFVRTHVEQEIHAHLDKNALLWTHFQQELWLVFVQMDFMLIMIKNVLQVISIFKHYIYYNESMEIVTNSIFVILF